MNTPVEPSLHQHCYVDFIDYNNLCDFVDFGGDTTSNIACPKSRKVIRKPWAGWCTVASYCSLILLHGSSNFISQIAIK